MLAVVLGGHVAFGLVVNAIVGAVWPRGIAGRSPRACRLHEAGWLATCARHWLVLPDRRTRSTTTRSATIAFVLLIALLLALTAASRAGGGSCSSCRRSVPGRVRLGERALIEESPTTRLLLLGAILIVLMASRPQGLFGTPRVEIV